MQSKTWLNIVMAIAIGYVIGIIILPQRFWWFNTTFVDYSDSLLSYAGAFYVTNGLLHGGIQLWDRYDQMPMTFFYLNFAMYKFSNVMTALIYIPLSWFSDSPAKLFQMVFSFVFIFSAMCVRAVGVYLLLSLFVKKRWILIAGTAYGIVMLSPQFLMGLSTNIIYSLFPLMMYFLLRFFDEFQFRHLFWFLGVWTYCISTDLFCGLGYLYQGTHFVILPGLVWMAFKHKEKLKDFKQWLKPKREHLIKLGMLLLLTLVMVGPGLYMIKEHKADYEFGLEQSRMKSPFSIKQYFARPAGWSPQGEFFTRMVDHTENLWSLNWLYVGGVALFFTLFGLSAIKDSRKWILFAAIVLFFAINCPRDANGIGAIGHWINALTNPLKFLPRSYHMSCSLLLPFLILPLCVAGFERFLDNKKDLSLRVAWALFFGVGVMVYGIIPLEAKKTLLIMTGLLLILSLIPKNKWLTTTLLIMLFTVDAWAMSQYLQGMTKTILVEPRPILARPDLGFVSMENQNPNILPIRYFSSLQQHSGVDTYLFESCTNMPGLMFRYTNFLRYYQRINNYLPRHISFATWVNDQGYMHNYVQQNPAMMYLTNKVDVDEKARTLNVSATLEQPTIELKRIVVDANHITYKKQKAYVLASFKMPGDLPLTHATNILSPDERLFALAVNGKPYIPAQGSLVVPETFDVNNVRNGFVSVALPISVAPKEVSLEFTYPKPSEVGLTGVFLNHMDSFGFTYNATMDGWLIMHEPYDNKWKVWIDDNPTTMYKSQGGFMAVKVTKGEHRIVLKYWPNHPVRWFLGLSIIISMVSLFWILWAAVREKER